MPLIQVGNVPYSGAGPLKFANAEFGGLRVVCPNLDVTVENNSTVQVPAGAVCQITATMVNTGEAEWLPASASSGGVVLQTSAGDVPLAAALPSLQRMALAPLAVTMGPSTLNLTGRMRAGASGEFWRGAETYFERGPEFHGVLRDLAQSLHRSQWPPRRAPRARSR